MAPVARQICVVYPKRAATIGLHRAPNNPSTFIQTGAQAQGSRTAFEFPCGLESAVSIGQIMINYIVN